MFSRISSVKWGGALVREGALIRMNMILWFLYFFVANLLDLMIDALHNYTKCACSGVYCLDRKGYSVGVALVESIVPDEEEETGK